MFSLREDGEFKLIAANITAKGLAVTFGDEARYSAPKAVAHQVGFRGHHGVGVSVYTLSRTNSGIRAATYEKGQPRRRLPCNVPAKIEGLPAGHARGSFVLSYFLCSRGFTSPQSAPNHLPFIVFFTLISLLPLPLTVTSMVPFQAVGVGAST